VPTGPHAPAVIDVLGPGVTNENLSSEILKLTYAFLVIAGITIVTAYIAVGGFMAQAVKMGNRLRVMYLQAVLRQDITFFDSQATTGALLTMLNKDIATVQDGLGEKCVTFIQNMATFAGGLVLAYVRGWRMSLVLSAGLPVMAGTFAAIGALVSWNQNQSAIAHRGAGSVSQESFQNMRTIAAFNAQRFQMERYLTKLDAPRKFEIAAETLNGAALGLMNFMFFALFGVAMWWGAKEVAWGDLTGGEVILVLFSIVIGGFSLGMGLAPIQNFQKASAAGGMIFHVIRRIPTIDDLSEAGTKPDRCDGLVEIRNAVFAYPSRPEAPVMRGFTLTIPAGKRTAIVGESGSGKSTTIALILRFYDPLQGQVLLDGRDLQEINVRWLRQQIGLVSQEPTLFDTSILENVRFGKPGATDEEVVEALKASNAWKFVQRLPNGVNTRVGEKGLHMSGGQKQRVAIARAIIKQPRILLLDEATSALDAQSEKVVQNALDNVSEGHTTVIVAHRLSTIRNADKIAVVSKGEIIEEGTHASLTLRQGAYAGLIRTQQGSVLSAMIPSFGGQGNVTAEAPDPRELTVVETHHLATGQGADPDAIARERSIGAASAQSKGKEKVPKPKVPSGRVWALSRDQWPLLVVGVIASGAVACAMPLFGWFLAEAIAAFFYPPDEVKEKVRKWVILFFLVGLANALGNFFQSSSLGYMGAVVARKLRGSMFKAMLRQDSAFYDDAANSTGNLSARLEKDAYYVRGAVSDNVAVTSQNIIMFALAYGLACSAQWKVALVITATFPVMIATSIFQTQFMTGFDVDSSKRLAPANATAADSITNAKVVQAFSLSRQVTGLFEDQLAGPSAQSTKKAHVSGLGFGFSSAFLYLMYALGFWYGAKLVKQGEATFEDIMQSIVVLLMAGQGLMNAQLSFPNLGKAAAAAIASFEMIDRVPDVDVDKEDGEEPETVVGDISFRDVVFRYPTRVEISVFNGFSLDVQANRTVALVGESGSGKSTAIALLLRFYDPEAGSITLDGRDIRSLSLHWMRSHIALVQQEPALFSGTIFENIAFGLTDVSREEVENAARLSNAHNFISGLPDGYDTQVGEGGAQLSGGQKQRVAIARAAIRNPRILLLDEATSALDAESERVVQEALEAASKNRTTIVVAHRLSTIRQADKIAVVKEGRVVEEGGHVALSMKPGGHYANLIKLQSK